jgi:hypothetical protein
MTRAGIINAKISNSKYLSIIDGCGDDDCDVDVAVLAALWILNPKINDDVATKKETSVRRFCVISQVSYLMSSYHLPNVLSRYSDIAVFCSSI